MLPFPSKEDWKLTAKLVKACDLMQIAFCDHIIIAGDEYFSFREEWAAVIPLHQIVREVNRTVLF